MAREKETVRNDGNGGLGEVLNSYERSKKTMKERGDAQEKG